MTKVTFTTAGRPDQADLDRALLARLAESAGHLEEVIARYPNPVTLLEEVAHTLPTECTGYDKNGAFVIYKTTGVYAHELFMQINQYGKVERVIEDVENLHYAGDDNKAEDVFNRIISDSDEV